jgi:hypothetical protein
VGHSTHSASQPHILTSPICKQSVLYGACERLSFDKKCLMSVRQLDHHSTDKKFVANAIPHKSGTIIAKEWRVATHVSGSIPPRAVISDAGKITVVGKRCAIRRWSSIY